MKALVRKLYHKFVHVFKEAGKGLDFITKYNPYCDSDEHGDKNEYSTLSYKQIKEIFAGYVDSAACVMDVGCGKGYALYVMRKIGFQKVLGIEYDEKLVQIAENNMKILNIADDIRIIHGDAGENFKELDEVNIIYLFNPFGAAVMKPFIDNLRRSLERSARAVMVVYVNPAVRQIWDDAQDFTLIEERLLRAKSGGKSKVCYYKYTREERA